MEGPRFNPRMPKAGAGDPFNRSSAYPSHHTPCGPQLSTLRGMLRVRSQMRVLGGDRVGSSGESRCVKIPCFQPARFSLHSHDLLQGIRGLSRPAGCPQAAGQPLHPERGARQSHRAGAEFHGRGAQPRRPHQRRGARDSGGLLRRDAQERRQLRRDVQEGQGRAGEEVQGGAMRLSREKLNKLASTTTDLLAGMKNVEFLEGYDDIRQEIRRLLEELLAGEEKLDKAARQKIESQRRIILEGTPEWNILYHKYYNEEVKKLGI